MKAFWTAAIFLLLTQTAQGQKTELVVETGHTDSVTSVAFNPNGSTLVSGSRDNTVRVWDVAAGRELHTFAGHKGWVTSVVFSPNGRIVASGSDDNTIRLWDISTARTLHIFDGYASSPAAFSPDGRVLASGDFAGTIRLWDLASGRKSRSFGVAGRWIKSIAFSPDGRTLAVSGSFFGPRAGDLYYAIRLCDVASGRELRTLSRQPDELNSLVFSPDGRLLASSSADSTVHLWDIASGREPRKLSGHHGVVNAVAFSPANGILASGSSDGTIKLWNVATGRELRTLAGHTSAVNSIAFSPDGRILASGSSDKTIKLWDIASGSELRTVATNHTRNVTSSAISPDGQYLASGSQDGKIRLWNATTGVDLHTLVGHSDAVKSVAFSPSGRLLASGSADNTIKLWEAASGTELRTLAGPASFVRCVAFSSDGRTLAAGTENGEIALWDLSDKTEVRILSGHTGWVGSIAFSPDGHTLASGSIDGAIKLWDFGSGLLVRTLGGIQFVHHRGVNSLAFSPDGRMLASGLGPAINDDGLIQLWDTSTGRELRSIVGVTNVVNSVAFSPDGSVLASGHDDATVRLWEVASGRELRTLIGHSNAIHSVTFSPDGLRLVSASKDASVRLWATGSGEQLAALYTFDPDDWAVVDPSGRFDASSGGMALMHYVVAKQCGSGGSTLEPIDLDQLKARYYEPGLLAKVLGFNKDPLRQVNTLDHVELYPEVELLTDGNNFGKLPIRVTNCRGGIGPIQVFVNGKKFIADARNSKLDANTTQLTLTVDLTTAPIIQGEHNEIRIVDWNAEGYVHSRGEILDYLPEAGTFTRGLKTAPSSERREQEYHGDLYAIVAGISNYSNQQLHLNFPSRDAESVARALQLAGDRLFGCGHVHISLFSSSNHAPTSAPCAIGQSTAPDDVRWAAPTKANIKKAFEVAAKARPQDVLVVYLSGHGVAFGDTYAYPTTEANTIEPNELFQDKRLLAETAITSDELDEWVRPQKIAATHDVMILDTCAAGAAAKKLSEKSQRSGDQTRALDRLEDNTGFYLLAGSAADKVSYEASRYGQGLLTYALLEGMRGPGLKNDLDVDVLRLFEYAGDRVHDLAEGIGGIQKPLSFARSGATSFAIGELNLGDRGRITIAEPMPIILAPRFINSVELQDDLSFESAVSARLRDATDVNGQGAARPISAVFVPSDEMPGAIRASGTYTIVQGQVTLKLGLFRDGKPLTTKIIQGPADDLSALAAEIVESILDVAKTIPPSS